jgi:diguanylate cyclase
VGLWHAGEKAQPAERVLARVAEEVRENPVVLPNGEEAHLTFSGGVGRWKAGDDAQSLFSKADEALYRAKKGGGNTVVRAD